MSENVSLVWFKTDLRLYDNPALNAAVQFASQDPSRRVVALFVVALGEWKHHDFAPAKVNLIMRQVSSIQNDLMHKLGIPLVVRTAQGFSDVAPIVLDTAQQLNASALYYNREYEVNEGKRDAQIKSELLSSRKRKAGTDETFKVFDFESQLMFENAPKLRTGEGKPYTVFTPFKKRWIAAVSPNMESVKPLSIPSGKTFKPQNTFTGSLHDFIQSHLVVPFEETNQTFPPAHPRLVENVERDWPAGEEYIRERLDKFVSEKGGVYKDKRDFPSIHGTSRLSAYQAIGAVSMRDCLAKALAANKQSLDSGNAGLVHWISELLWREFYRYILINFPRVCKNRPFKLETDRVAWVYDRDLFQKWCEGQTGYPLVDAAMRALKETGWMHNRLRMVTAMFLTKDLLIDWRWGEKYFMQNLVDGDFASNNGGWQWAASTGTDSQPYFRVFNPYLQSSKFDADGTFIRQYVPELRNVKGKAIHEPNASLRPKELQVLQYPMPLVDHAHARTICIEAFKKAAALTLTKR